MAAKNQKNPKKRNKTTFKPGDKSNPVGRPKLPTDIHEIRKMETVEFIRTINKFLSMTVQQFQEYIKTKKPSVREMRIAKMIEQELQGQIRYTIEMNDRLMGKALQEVKLTGDTDNPFRIAIEKSLDGF